MKTFSSPSDLRAFVLNLADEFASAGMPEASGRLREAATLPCTTGSEWLGELGLAVREIQQKHRFSSTTQDALESVMAAVHVAWPKM
jgi:hypothetical protein